MEHQLVVFELADEFYGVDISGVESIIKLQDITAVPHAPDFVEGVTNLRGTVLPVIDLRRRFCLQAGERNGDTRIVVVDVDGSKVGMIVDAVTEVLRVPDEAIEPPSPLVVTINSAFITGIAKMEGRLVILIDLSRVLSMDEKTELQAVKQPVAGRWQSME
jgi:purine-binding chemotaxis protein CheW